jgi:CDP-diacylglycerol---glycerol-3-phosphate 3-phosphatidyltransferase
MNIATYITCLRIFLGPIFLTLYLKHTYFGISFESLPYFLLALLALLEFSDAIDGYLARKLNKVTDLGKLLDPMADSISRISVFLTFTTGFLQLPLILVFVFFYRDALVSTLRAVCALQGFALAARTSGKIKAIFQAIVCFAIVLMMLPYSWGWISLETYRLYSTITVGVVALYAALSAVDYFYANRVYVRSVLKK